MAMTSFIHVVLLALVVVSLQTSATKSSQSHIVYVNGDGNKHDRENTTQWHIEILKSVAGSEEKAKELMIYSYKIIPGFAARLTKYQAKRLKTHPDVSSVVKSGVCQLHVLSLEQHGNKPSESPHNISRYGNDTIIGIIYTGAWPESKSFDDKGFGPIPSRWKGVCMNGSNPTFKCNKKLIGARYFHFDTPDHNKHTKSTNEGNVIKERGDVYGFEKGVVKRESSNARMAAYKIGSSDIELQAIELLAAFDAAIGDGVNVLSIQVNKTALDCMPKVMATGSSQAVRHGVKVIKTKTN